MLGPGFGDVAPDQALSFLEVFSGRSPKYKGWFVEPTPFKVHHLSVVGVYSVRTPARIRAAMVGPQVGLLFANGMSLEQPSFHKTMPTYAICEALSVNHSWKYISDLTISHLNFPK